jgi:hypothetical protein
MPELEKLSDEIWVATAQHSLCGLHLGTRMTVVRLSNGGLWIHSPVEMSPRLRQQLDSLGEVKHIVCPNMYHHVYAAQAVAAYPAALLHGPHALRRKRRDLVFSGTLSDTPHPDWDGDLVPLMINGSLLRETVFFHTRSRTLITSDLVENFRSSPHWPTRTYLKLCGIHGNITWSKPLRMLYRDPVLARTSIDRLLKWPFERIVIAHGELILDNAHSSLERGLSWLKAP